MRSFWDQLERGAGSFCSCLEGGGKHRDADALQISTTLQLYDVFSSRIGKKKLLNLSGKLCSAEDWMQRWDTTQRFWTPWRSVLQNLHPHNQCIPHLHTHNQYFTILQLKSWEASLNPCSREHCAKVALNITVRELLSHTSPALNEVAVPDSTSN